MTTNEVADAFGRPIGFLFVLRDVTETRRSQEVLVQALDREREAVRRLRMLDAAKDDFVSTVSHELRTPMTSIIGFAEMLEDGDVGALDGRQLAVVEKISRNGERLLALADDLLGLAGFESGTHEPEAVELDLREVARLGVTAIRDQLRNRELALEVGSPDEPITVRGDSGHLERVMANLVGNAVKFTPDGGRVRVDVRRDGEQAVVEVADTGIGIPADEVDAVFDKFFRSRNAEHHAIQGSGLGLAIVQAIVHNHQGSIDVASAEGHGTTFTVRLPVG
jgi:signal transduction histidine kinase